MNRVAFLSDIHFPCHHKQAWDLTLKILPELNLDLIHIGGDGIEFESLSRFSVPPDRRILLKNDIKITLRELTKLRSCIPDIPIEWRCGNHEYRLERYIYSKSPELDGVNGISVPEMFNFSNFDIQWIPRIQERKIGKLMFMHGDEVRVGSIYPARNLYFKISGNVIAGHFHTEGKYIHTLSDKTIHGVWINACLRSLRPEWAPFSQWSNGFTVIEFSTGGFFHVTQILYIRRNGKMWANVGGVEFFS